MRGPRVNGMKIPDCYGTSAARSKLPLAAGPNWSDVLGPVLGNEAAARFLRHSRRWETTQTSLSNTGKRYLHDGGSALVAERADVAKFAADLCNACAVTCSACRHRCETRLGRSALVGRHLERKTGR